MNQNFSGIFTALVTPFKNGNVDFGSLERLVTQQLNGGVQGFVISGTTAESPTITKDEKKKIFEAVKAQTEGKVPLVVGTGTNSTAETIELSREAARWGADGLLVVVPYYNKPPQRGLVEHYSAVASATELPVLLYNVPSRTITALSLETIEELSKNKKVVGIKEASGDLSFDKKIRERCGSKFVITSGDDATWLQLIADGGNGVISVLSHVIPDVMRILLTRVQAGDLSALRDFDNYQELVRLLFAEANPIPVKAALKIMGVIDSDELRLPLVRISDDLKEKLIVEMRRLEVIG